MTDAATQSSDGKEARSTFGFPAESPDMANSSASEHSDGPRIQKNPIDRRTASRRRSNSNGTRNRFDDLPNCWEYPDFYRASPAQPSDRPQDHGGPEISWCHLGMLYAVIFLMVAVITLWTTVALRRSDLLLADTGFRSFASEEHISSNRNPLPVAINFNPHIIIGPPTEKSSFGAVDPDHCVCPSISTVPLTASTATVYQPMSIPSKGWPNITASGACPSQSTATVTVTSAQQELLTVFSTVTELISTITSITTTIGIINSTEAGNDSVPAIATTTLIPTPQSLVSNSSTYTTSRSFALETNSSTLAALIPPVTLTSIVRETLQSVTPSTRYFLGGPQAN